MEHDWVTDEFDGATHCSKCLKWHVHVKDQPCEGASESVKEPLELSVLLWGGDVVFWGPLAEGMSEAKSCFYQWANDFHVRGRSIDHDDVDIALYELKVKDKVALPLATWLGEYYAEIDEDRAADEVRERKLYEQLKKKFEPEAS